jgi:hypothetical protein
VTPIVANAWYICEWGYVVRTPCICKVLEVDGDRARVKVYGRKIHGTEVWVTTESFVRVTCSPYELIELSFGGEFVVSETGDGVVVADSSVGAPPAQTPKRRGDRSRTEATAPAQPDPVEARWRSRLEGAPLVEETPAVVERREGRQVEAMEQALTSLDTPGSFDVRLDVLDDGTIFIVHGDPHRAPPDWLGATWPDAVEKFVTAFVGKPQKTGYVVIRLDANATVVRHEARFGRRIWC